MRTRSKRSSLTARVEALENIIEWRGNPPEPGDIVLTPEQAEDGATYQEALKMVGHDHSKIKVKRRWDNWCL